MSKPPLPPEGDGAGGEGNHSGRVRQLSGRSQWNDIAIVDDFRASIKALNDPNCSPGMLVPAIPRTNESPSATSHPFQSVGRENGEGQTSNQALSRVLPQKSTSPSNTEPTIQWTRTIRWLNPHDQINFATTERISRTAKNGHIQWTRLALATLIDGNSIPFPANTRPEVSDWATTGQPKPSTPDALTAQIERIVWTIYHPNEKAPFPAKSISLPEGTVQLTKDADGNWSITYTESPGANSITLIGTADLDAKGDLNQLRLKGSEIPLPNSPFRAEVSVTQLRTPGP
jgi:hypothetical protein